MMKRESKKKGRGIFPDLIRDRQLYLMLVPVLLYYIIFYFKPLGGLKMAFQDYKPFLGIEGSAWVGWDNFITYLTGPYFKRTFRNTIVISLLNLVFSFPIPIILAFLFNEVRSRRARTVYQTISYLPHFISSVVVCGIVIEFLSPSDGLINILIQKLGGESIYFLTKPEWFRTIFILQGIWQGAGFGSIMYYSALCGIDTSLYEAVAIDGGGRLRQLWHIALPGIAPTIAVTLIMQIGNILSVGSEKIILLYTPSTYETADVISSYVYRVGMEGGNYSLSTAVGLFNGMISLVLVICANKVSKKVGEISVI